jgi:hypothetical protein
MLKFALSTLGFINAQDVLNADHLQSHTQE